MLKEIISRRESGSTGSGGGGTNGGPVAYNSIVKYDWDGAATPDYSDLRWQSNGRQDGTVVSNADAEAGDVFRCFIARKGSGHPEDDAALNVEKNARQELRVYGVPDPYQGANNTHLRLNQRYIIRYRMRITPAWEIDTQNVNLLSSGKFTDKNCSLIEFKQDWYPSGGIPRTGASDPTAPNVTRNREASLALRVDGQLLNIIIRESPTLAGDRTFGTINQIKRQVDISNLFNYEFFDIWIDALWSADVAQNPHMRIYINEQQIVNYEGPNAHNDAEWLGPYVKFGLYDSWWKAGNDPGADYRETEVDIIDIGIPV